MDKAKFEQPRGDREAVDTYLHAAHITGHGATKLRRVSTRSTQPVAGGTNRKAGPRGDPCLGRSDDRAPHSVAFTLQRNIDQTLVRWAGLRTALTRLAATRASTALPR